MHVPEPLIHLYLHWHGQTETLGNTTRRRITVYEANSTNVQVSDCCYSLGKNEATRQCVYRSIDYAKNSGRRHYYAYGQATPERIAKSCAFPCLLWHQHLHHYYL